MRISVVICTYNRADALRDTLDALRWQTHPDFEVVVVNGPSDDGTVELLRERAGELRVVDCELRRLSVSRNLGIAAAAGEVVAFIDDDAVPEPRWLEDLAAAYDDERVGGAGGLTLDESGVRAQYRYAVCSRLGHTDFDRRPPLDAFNRPGADPFLYVQGTNCSFRRSVLARIGGFDEDIEMIYDEVEVCSRVLDAGYELRALEDAVVHHKTLPSHVRSARGPGDPLLPVKNRVHFGLRAGRGFASQAEILLAASAHTEGLKEHARAAREGGVITWGELERYVARADEGFSLGLDSGLAGHRRGGDVGEAPADAFRPYPRVTAAGRQLAVCFIALDYPPAPVAGIARYSQDLAEGFAAAGHEAHVVTRHDGPEERTDFESGVWVHRIPIADRYIPELDGHPLKGNLDHLAAVRGAVLRVAARAPLDVVTGPLWIAEPLLCALDPDLRVNVVCISPMAKIAELQPEVAAAPLTEHQMRLETALLRAPTADLVSVSHENAAVCEAIAGRPLTTIWLGVADRRDRYPRGRTGDEVEILYVGRQEPRKGIDTLLEASVELLREHPELRLRLCGADNPHANPRPAFWTEWIAAHAGDVAGRIRVDDQISDDELFAAYADADVFCGPSRYESFGLVHVEAMMMGLPVVGCDVGGMRETIVDGETGALVTPGDPAALRAALARLIADPDLRARQGAAGRARYEREFAIAIAVQRTATHFEGLASAEPASGAPLATTAALLADVCSLEPAAAERAAAALLDRSRYPFDPERSIRDAFRRDSDDDFVTQVYRTLLGRDPEAGARAAFVHRVRSESRPAIVREIAASDEARARGLPAEFAARAPEQDERTLAPALVAAGFADDDGAYVAELDRLLLGGEATPAQRDGWTRRLAEGGARGELVRELLASPPAARRIAAPDRLDAGEPRSENDLTAALVAAGSDDAFLAQLYAGLLGRALDADAEAGLRHVLGQGVDRGVVALEIGRSEEAAARGVPGEVATRIARAVSARSPGRRDVARSVVRRLGTRSEPAAAVPAPASDPAAIALRLDDLTAELREQRSSHAQHVAELEARLAAGRADAEVMTRKYEAIALDLRDRLPPAPPPEPPADVDVDAVRRSVRGMGELRVNVGCGEKPLPGYVNVDQRALPGVDVVADAGNLPFDPGSVSELAAFHLVEHFREHHAATVLLPHWRSRLRPDGLLRLVTPNWSVLLEQLRTGERTFAEFKAVTYGLQEYSGDDHFALYTPETLTDLLERAGFERIAILAERRQNGMSPELEVIARPR